MAPQYIKTITVVQPDEFWETRTSGVAYPTGEGHELGKRQTGPSLAPWHSVATLTAESIVRRTREAAPTPENTLQARSEVTGTPLAPAPPQGSRATSTAGSVIAQHIDASPSTLEKKLRTSTVPAPGATASSAIAPRSQERRAIKGHPIHRMRVRAEEPPALSPAKKFYGVVPNSPSRRAEIPIDGFQTQVKPAYTAVEQNGSAFTLGPAQGIHDPLPDMPPWFPWLLLGVIATGFISAILLYFVNFPPTLRWLRGTRRQKHGYQKIEGDHIELDEYHPRILTTSINVPPTGFSTSADSPAFPSLKKRSKLNVDTTSANAGLGIELAGELGHELRKRKSFDDRLYLAGRSPAATPSSQQQAFTAPLPTRQSPLSSPQILLKTITSRTILRQREPDLEDGLLTPQQRQTPSPPSSEHSSRSSSRVRLFEKIGDGVEYAADYLAKMMNDQVKDDPEEGLLLPIRAEERQFKWEGEEAVCGFENGKWKKTC